VVCVAGPAWSEISLGGYHNMHWLYLTFAILTEVAGTTCMKLSAGFTKVVGLVAIIGGVVALNVSGGTH